ncbi:MAG: GntR family transcriptional regulator [Desulfobacteraceae bacterium]
MGLDKIDKPKPLAKIALDALRRSILSNELTPNVVYNEKALAQSLGISRTPVREALLELSSKRLVRFLPQKGVIINTFSDKDIEEVFEIRTALELFSINKICNSTQKLDSSSLKKCLDDQREAFRNNAPVEFMDADRALHIGFTALTRNEYLLEMMQGIRDIMHLMGFRALDIDGRMQEVVTEHEKILAAVEQKDSQAAMEQMENHLNISKEAVKKMKHNEET